MRAYITMLPRLQAEENLSSINIGMLSSGYANKKDVTKAINRLERIASGGRRKPLKATPQTLAAMGIGVVNVPPSSPKTEADNV